jgi:hypothetical protein
MLCDLGTVCRFSRMRLEISPARQKAFSFSKPIRDASRGVASLGLRAVIEDSVESDFSIGLDDSDFHAAFAICHADLFLQGPSAQPDWSLSPKAAFRG